MLAEAMGMARAMSDTGIPYIIVLPSKKTGNLLMGIPSTMLSGLSMISISQTGVLYDKLCTSLHLYEALAHNFNQTEAVRTRFIGIQANTSALSYSELDGSADLQSSSPADLAEGMMKLKSNMILGYLAAVAERMIHIWKKSPSLYVEVCNGGLNQYHSFLYICLLTFKIPQL